MAITQEFYRLRGRNVRFSTQLQSLYKGMYLTNQNVPEGFAKVLVNYDIDDTGACIKTKKGRNLHVAIPYAGYHNLGKMHITDYIYTYNNEVSEIEDIKDLIMSFGTYDTLRNQFKDYVLPSTTAANLLDTPIFVAKQHIKTDTNIYDDQQQIVGPGEITEQTIDSGWALYCNKGSEVFHTIENEDIGFITARTIKNAYAFDKKIVKNLGLPISTVLANEVYAFSAPKIEFNNYPPNTEKNNFSALSYATLTKFQIYNTDNGYKLRRNVIEPKKINPTEAQNTGFNMLSTSPFLLSDVSGGAPRILGALVYPTRDSDIPILSYDVGGAYAMRVYYQYQVSGTAYKYKLEVLDANKTDAGYSVVTDWTNFTSGDLLWIPITPPYMKTEYRITIRIGDQTETESRLPKLIDCEPNNYNKLENKEFDLTTAKGMVSWLGCIGVYGVKDASNTIFFSDIEDPSYFPFPNNTITFDNEILAVYNYLDMLLVITTDSIVLVIMGNSIATCTQRKVMANIFIPEIDAVNVVILKDQIFFKTDTQFYVLKPNTYTSDATDLKNFTNSTAVANYTVHFTAETINILNKVYRNLWYAESAERRKIVHFTDFDVLNVESVVKNEEVHYVYTLLPYVENKTFGYLNLHLVYNTVTRSWRMYMVGIGDETVSYTAKLYRNKQSGAFYEVIPYNLKSESNILIVKESLNGRDDNVVHKDWQLTPYYNNYNYLDTGVVAINDVPNKRFRELQMNIVSHEQSKIKFYADVKIDNKLNIDSTEYEVQHITDPSDPEYGLIYVIPTATEDYHKIMTAYGDTTLEDENQELVKYWEIDLSAFPDLEIATIKLKLFGKGRRASFQVLCTDLKNYELSTFTWVYRIMSVR